MISLIHCEDVVQASGAAKTILNAELNFHGRNIGEVHSCLKKHLGTNSAYWLFNKCLRDRKPILEFAKLRFLHELMDNFKLTTTFSFGKFIFNSLIQIIVYSWDLVKDLYFLAYYSHFGQISISNFGSFDSQVLIVLIISITLPNLLNVVVLLKENLSTVPCKVRRLLVLIVFLSVSVTNYALNKIQYIKGRNQKSLEKLTSSAKGRHSGDSQRESVPLTLESKFQNQECQLTSLLAKLKINEGIFESSIQAIVLMITVAVSLRYIFNSLTRVAVFKATKNFIDSNRGL